MFISSDGFPTHCGANIERSVNNAMEIINRTMFTKYLPDFPSFYYRLYYAGKLYYSVLFDSVSFHPVYLGNVSSQHCLPEV